MKHLLATATVILAALSATDVARAQTPQPPPPVPQPAPGTSAHAVVRSADSSTTLLLTLKDGSVVQGRVRAVENDTVSFASTVGALRLALADVRNARVVRAQDLHDGEYWFPNPNTTRLLFAPTGRMLDAGKGYFSDYMIFFPGVAIGVTNEFTLGGGMSVFPGNLSPSQQVFYFTPKVGILQSDRVNVAVGALAIHAGSGNETLGLLYSVGTFGSENGSFTAGLGYGFQGSNLADSPAIMIGLDKRISPRFGLVSENYLFPSAADGPLGSIGLRFFGEKMAFDFGLFTFIGDNNGFVFPFVGLVANF